MKNFIIYILVISLFIFLGVEFEIWRWHTFQQLTHSSVPFWKYMLLFGKG